MTGYARQNVNDYVTLVTHGATTAERFILDSRVSSHFSHLIDDDSNDTCEQPISIRSSLKARLERLGVIMRG